MDLDALRYGRIGPRHQLPENPWFIEPNINEEEAVRGNVLRKRTGASSQNSELKRGKIGGKLPIVNRCKQSKSPQTKAKGIEKVKFNEEIGPVKEHLERGKTMSYGILKQQRV